MEENYCLTFIGLQILGIAACPLLTLASLEIMSIATLKELKLNFKKIVKVKKTRF